VARSQPRKRAGWPYLVLLAGVMVVGLFYRPSAHSASIDIPLSLPRIREVEITGAEWSVKRRLDVWDHISFRDAHIARHEGRVSVCGEVRADPNADFRRYIETGGDVVLESPDQANFIALWESLCQS
jgi:hypothetical protein